MGRRRQLGSCGGSPAQGVVPSQDTGRRRLIVLVNAIMAVLGLLLGGLVLAGPVVDREPSGPTAAIVDQLSLTYPNPAFVEAATNTLKAAGYRVDYIPGEHVGVGFYRSLPSRDYDLVILRVHSALNMEMDYVALFTSQPYVEGGFADWKPVWVSYSQDDPIYFGVGPEFIDRSMRGRFDGALVVMMGCNGLTSKATAEAFLGRGAKAVVAWNGDVSPEHTDAATERLLEKLVMERLPVEDAAAQTAAEVGPDPVYGAQLTVLTAER